MVVEGLEGLAFDVQYPGESAGTRVALENPDPISSFYEA